MKAITTRYFGPSTVKGSRIKATEPGGVYIFHGYRSEFSSEENHEAAAHALCSKLNWRGKKLVGGDVAGGGMVWLFLDEQHNEDQ